MGDPMKELWQKIVTLYAQNGKFHTFVAGLEGAVVAAAITWPNGLPTSKSAFVTLAAFLGKAAWGWFLGWSRNNVAQPSLQGVGGAPIPTEPKA